MEYLLLRSDLPFSGDIGDRPKFGAHLAVPARHFQRLDFGPSCAPKNADYRVYKRQYCLCDMDVRRICSSTTDANAITRLTVILRWFVQDLSNVNREEDGDGTTCRLASDRELLALLRE